MAGLIGARACALFLSVALVGTAQAQTSRRPAELPPPGYAGLQYVDSKGCAFLRAGTPAKPIWVPRVTSEGRAVCGYPPSGKRVAAAGERGADTRVFDPAASEPGTARPAQNQPQTPAAKPAEPKPKATAKTPAKPAAPQAAKPETAAPAATAGPGYVVAMGSFGVESNAKRATNVAQALGYPVVLSQLKTRSQTLVSVMAGPFATMADAELALGKLRDMGFRDAIVMRRR